MTATGNDYPDASMIVDVEDDDSYELTLGTDKPFYAEGESVVLTATISQAMENDVKVDITNTATGRFYPFLRSITIPAGLLSAQGVTAVVNDDKPMADATVTFTGTATGFTTAKKAIGIQDDDILAYYHQRR
jgi:hypothetical protein